jgi:hypothetical protein
MKKIMIMLVLLVTLIIQGCSIHTLVKNDKGSAKVYKLKADRRVTYFIYDYTNNKTFTLSEPSPDVILERTTDITNKLGIGNATSDTVSTSQKIKLANKAIELGERTVAVNILRDALFRLNEMNINNRNAPIEVTYKTLFDSILNASKQIALAEVIKQKKELIEAKNEEAKINIVEKASALDLYQKGIQFLLNKDDKNALNHFKKMFADYPTYFNIDEINKKLIELSKPNFDNSKWKELYNFIVNANQGLKY